MRTRARDRWRATLNDDAADDEDDDDAVDDDDDDDDADDDARDDDDDDARCEPWRATRGGARARRGIGRERAIGGCAAHDWG